MAHESLVFISFHPFGFSQYSKDRQFIMERLNTHKEDSNILFRALEKNTEVMNDLKIQIATLAKAIEALEN